MFSQAYESPGLTMLQNSTDSNKVGFASSINQSILTIGGLAATTLLGITQQYYNAPEHVEIYGQSLAAVLGFSYIFSTPFYFLAGREYNKLMTKKD